MLRDCGVDFTELSEKVFACEAICERVCESMRMTISCPSKYDQRIVSLSRSVRAERGCCRPIFQCACMHLQLQGCFGVYVCCQSHSVLMSSIYEKLIVAVLIWVSMMCDREFVFW